MRGNLDAPDQGLRGEAGISPHRAQAVVVDDRARSTSCMPPACCRGFVAVVRYKGPRANGMPECIRWRRCSACCRTKGGAVALLTDGRLSARPARSGRDPPHPEAARGGPIARLREGDVILIDAEAGILEVSVPIAANGMRVPRRRIPRRQRTISGAIYSRSTAKW